MSELHIALTGHRPYKLDGYELKTPFYHALVIQLKNHVIEKLNTYDTVWIHTGMALGADTIWGCVAYQLKKVYGQRIKLHAEIPVMTQPDIWVNAIDKNRWHFLFDLSDAQTIYAKSYTRECLMDRNAGMIDHADELIAIWDGTRSGTMNAVNYAKQQNVPTIIIDPNDIFKQL